jgi:hypothetical protein
LSARIDKVFAKDSAKQSAVRVEFFAIYLVTFAFLDHRPVANFFHEQITQSRQQFGW